MASAVDSRLAYARLSAVAMASRLPTANRGSTNSYTTSWDTTRPQRSKADNLLTILFPKHSRESLRVASGLRMERQKEADPPERRPRICPEGPLNGPLPRSHPQRTNRDQDREDGNSRGCVRLRRLEFGKPRKRSMRSIPFSPYRIKYVARPTASRSISIVRLA